MTKERERRPSQAKPSQEKEEREEGGMVKERRKPTI
jgi:hypothetical protein